MSSSSLTSSLLLLAVAALAALACVESAQIIGDAAVILEETDAERWTDISAKKLESQKAAHDEEFKVDWDGLEKAQTREQNGHRVSLEWWVNPGFDQAR